MTEWAVQADTSSVELCASVRPLLEALLAKLGLEVAAVRLRDSGARGEAVLTSRDPRPSSWQPELRALADEAATEGGARVSRRAVNPLGDGELSFVVLRLGQLSDVGTLVVASGRVDFPDERESMLLELAANQATIVLLERENQGWQRAEQALSERELESGMIMDNIPNLVSILSANGTPELINRQILDYTGKTEAELKNWGGSDLVHPEDRECAIDGFRRGIPSGEPFEITYRMLGADGAYRWFHARHRPLKELGGRVFRWCVSVSDIDDRVRAEEALRESDRRSRSIIDGIPGFVATLTPGGEVEAVNRQILEYTGCGLAELQNWGTNGIVHPDDMPDVAEIFLRSIAAGVPYQIEQRLRRHDGVYRWFSNRGIPAHAASGTILRWYVLLIDIEDRRKAETALGDLRSELARLSRISSLGALTASVAHEVNQPLAGIITNATTCQRMLGADPPNVEGALETARRTLRDGNRAAEVVARLRNLFSNQAKRYETLDLNEAAAEVVALVSSDLQRNRVMLRVDYAKALPRLRADRVQLQQVVLNLVSNAFDAMSGVSDRQRTLMIRTTHDCDGVCLSVEDSGVGFALVDQERLFEAFYTTKSAGMGIGLSVSRSIIESHRGRLWGQTNAGPGVTFSFSIPIERQR